MPSVRCRTVRWSLAGLPFRSSSRTRSRGESASVANLHLFLAARVIRLCRSPCAFDAVSCPFDFERRQCRRGRYPRHRDRPKRAPTQRIGATRELHGFGPAASSSAVQPSAAGSAQAFRPRGSLSIGVRISHGAATGPSSRSPARWSATAGSRDESQYRESCHPPPDRWYSPRLQWGLRAR